jgi:hypothetical protein
MDSLSVYVYTSSFVLFRALLTNIEHASRQMVLFLSYLVINALVSVGIAPKYWSPKIIAALPNYSHIIHRQTIGPWSYQFTNFQPLFCPPPIHDLPGLLP